MPVARFCGATDAFQGGRTAACEMCCTTLNGMQSQDDAFRWYIYHIGKEEDQLHLTPSSSCVRGPMP